jgi:hypothetical protein
LEDDTLDAGLAAATRPHEEDAGFVEVGQLWKEGGREGREGGYEWIGALG